MFTKSYHSFKYIKVTERFALAEVKVTFLFRTKNIIIARSNSPFENDPIYSWTEIKTGKQIPELRKLEKLQIVYDMLNEKSV